MSRVPVVVLAAPGVGGAQLAATIAAAGGRPAAVHDEVADAPLGDRDRAHVLRAACRDVLWRRDRDWTCPPARIEVEDGDRALVEQATQLLRDGAVLYDVALFAVLPVLVDALAEDTALEVVVAVRQPAAALPAVLSAHDLDEDHADDLLRTVNARLAALAVDVPVTVVDLDDLGAAAASAAGLADATVEELVPLPDVPAVDAVEPDPAVDQLLGVRDRATGDDAHRCGGAIDVATLLAALRRPGAVDDALELHAGPRTAARRAVLRGLATTGGPWGPVLETTRASGPGAWAGREEDLEVVRVDGMGRLRRHLQRPAATVTTHVLSDLTTWCDRDQLRVALELSSQVVVGGGTVAVGRAPADDEVRGRAGLPPLTDDEVVEAGRGAGLLPLPVRRDGELRVLPFSARTSMTETIEHLRTRVAELEAREDDLRAEAAGLYATLDEQRAKVQHFRDRSRDLSARVARLEERVARTTGQRDEARQRYDELRQRRVVRAVLGVVDRLGAVLRRLRVRG